MKTKFKEPELFIGDQHGIYIGKFAYEALAERYKAQVAKHMSAEAIKSLQDTCDEFYNESCDELTEITFKTETGQKWQLQYAEGGMWGIPFCFLRSKKANYFFGN